MINQNQFLKPEWRRGWAGVFWWGFLCQDTFAYLHAANSPLSSADITGPASYDITYGCKTTSADIDWETLQVTSTEVTFTAPFEGHSIKLNPFSEGCRPLTTSCALLFRQHSNNHVPNSVSIGSSSTEMFSSCTFPLWSIFLHNGPSVKCHRKLCASTCRH